MRPKNYYEAPVGPKDYDEIRDPSLKVKSINSRIDIIKEAIHASIIQGTQELLIHLLRPHWYNSNRIPRKDFFSAASHSGKSTDPEESLRIVPNCIYGPESRE